MPVLTGAILETVLKWPSRVFQSVITNNKVVAAAALAASRRKWLLARRSGWSTGYLKSYCTVRQSRLVPSGAALWRPLRFCPDILTRRNIAGNLLGVAAPSSCHHGFVMFWLPQVSVVRCPHSVGDQNMKLEQGNIKFAA